MSADELFKAAPRQKAVVEVAGMNVEIIELSLFQRLECSDIGKKTPGNQERFYAEMVKRACPIFKDKTVLEIIDNLKPSVLLELATKVLELCDLKDDTKKKSGAAKKDSSTASHTA